MAFSVLEAKRVLELSEQGLDTEAIHQETGASPQIITQVVRGTWKRYETLGLSPSSLLALTDSEIEERFGGGSPARSGKHVRCPGCGSMVKMPCLICEAREGRSRKGC